MGIVEAWVREKPIRTFLARLAQRRAAAAATFLASSTVTAAIDGEGGGEESIPQLSSIANSVVSRCSRIIAISTENLLQSFETDFPHNCNEPNTYARELLEYCCHKALHEVTTRPDYLADKNLRRLMFDMMLAWETPGSEDASVRNVRNFQGFILLLATIFQHHIHTFERKINNFVIMSSFSFGSFQPFSVLVYLMNFVILSDCCDGQGSIVHDSIEIEDEDEGSIFYANSTNLAVQVDDKKTVGLNAFAKIAPSCPIIADLVTVHNLFDVLTSSSGGRLHFLVYDKYLKSLDRELKSVKGIMQSPLASSFHLDAGECILAIDGDKPIHPVFQHIGISAWPGRLVLTTHALYFQSIKVGYGDKVVKYDLATDSNQVIKRDLTGPLGVRLFDKAVMYKSSTLTDPIYFDFPELGGPSRRDYWLAITREVLQVNRFIRKFNLGDVQRAEALSKAILGILRYSAVKEAFHIAPSHFKTTLTFSLAEKLPKGDMVLEALYNNYFQLLDSSLSHLVVDKMPENHSVPFSLYALSRMGFLLLKRKDETEKEISFCAVCFGVTKSLEAALEESICYSERIESARATVDQVKVEGIDANLALMQELLSPFIQVGKIIYSLSKWEDPLKSLLFLAFMLYVIQRGLVSYIVPFVLLTFAVVILWRKYIGGGKLLEVLEVKPPPSKNAVEQILILQEGISKLEDSLQAVNIALLKFRSVLFASVPKATEVVAAILTAAAIFLLFIPSRHLLLMFALDLYTREMPLRKQSTEKFRRRIREWWARIPAAPVQMIRPNETKKKR